MRLLLLIATTAACSAGSQDHAIDAGADAAASDASMLGLTHVPLTGCGFSFTGDFAIGGSKERLTVDTGSQTLAVAGASCVTCSDVDVSPLYTPGPTATDLHATAMETYDDGDMTWNGEVYADQVSAGSLPAIHLGFVEITSQGNFFGRGECGLPDGILGLSPAGGLIPGTTSFPTQLAASGATDMFAIHYCLATGDLWLDGYDPAAATAEPSWAPMFGTEEYAVAVDDVAVDGTSVGVPAATYGVGIVDSGGPTLFVPTAAYTAITTMVGASPAFTSRFGGASWFANRQCTTLAETRQQLDAELPTLTVTIGSPPISIELPATAGYIQSYATQSGISYCPALNSTTGGMDLGNTLIRAGLVIFDREHQRLGFAPTQACDDVVAQPLARVTDRMSNPRHRIHRRR